MMFEFLKTTCRRLRGILTDALDALTCHRACYAYVAMTYYCGVVHMLDKDTVSQIVMAIYLALAVRG